MCIYFSQNVIFQFSCFVKNKLTFWVQKVHDTKTDKSHDIMGYSAKMFLKKC